MRRLLALLALTASCFAAETLPLWEGRSRLRIARLDEFADSPPRPAYTVHLPAKPNGAADRDLPRRRLWGIGDVGGEGHGIAKPGSTPKVSPASSSNTVSPPAAP